MFKHCFNFGKYKHRARIKPAKLKRGEKADFVTECLSQKKNFFLIHLPTH